jgi:hypothetical protein
MSTTQTPLPDSDLVNLCVARIHAHLARLAAGQDPLGHLFGVERLARAARAELWQSEREAHRSRNGLGRP